VRVELRFVFRPLLTVLGVITARGGSKGVPRKNLRPLGGKPLLAWTAEAALAAKRLTRVILSTEDEEIAEVGRSCGVEVPFLRPAELALDATPTLPVLQHAAATLERRGARFDAVCLLQPTSPLRLPEDIDGCVELLERSGADAVATLCPVPPEFNPHWVYFENGNGFFRLSTGETAPVPRRQELPAAYHRDGSVYVTRRNVLMEGNSLYGTKLAGYIVDPKRRVNIDTPADWERAEALIEAARR
jgi:CMP-N-acetylneuraminic acid synthetase